MRCHEFELRLNAVLDDRRDPAADALLAAHAAQCADCRQVLAAQRALFAGLAELAVPPIAGDFSRRVVSQTAVVRRAGGRGYLAMGVVAATAAAVLLAVAIVWRARDGGTPLAVSPEPTAPVVEVDRGTPGRPLGMDPGSLALMNRNLLIEAPRLPQHVRGGYHEAMDNLSTALPEAVELEDVERIAPGIRPIRSTLGQLWDALCGADPASAAPPQPASGEALSPALLDVAALRV